METEFRNQIYEFRMMGKQRIPRALKLNYYYYYFKKTKKQNDNN